MCYRLDLALQSFPGTPFRQQTFYRKGVPDRSGLLSPLLQLLMAFDLVEKCQNDYFQTESCPFSLFICLLVEFQVNYDCYVDIEKIQFPVCEATQLVICGKVTMEVSQQRCGEVVQQKCSEVIHQERGEKTEQRYDEVTSQECGEVTQRECSEVSHQECGEVPQKECSEATQQECGEFSSGPEENVEETTSYIFSLTLVEIKQNARKWDLESECTN